MINSYMALGQTNTQLKKKSVIGNSLIFLFVKKIKIWFKTGDSGAYIRLI